MKCSSTWVVLGTLQVASQAAERACTLEEAKLVLWSSGELSGDTPICSKLQCFGTMGSCIFIIEQLCTEWLRLVEGMIATPVIPLETSKICTTSSKTCKAKHVRFEGLEINALKILKSANTRLTRKGRQQEQVGTQGNYWKS